MPHCGSHEIYKGILGDQSRAVFNGKIIVRPDAQKTDAKQTNKALLLSDDANINSKPELEIFANDVKCTHGAAIGQLDDAAMFYLRSRGLGVAESRAMLVHAFAGDILNRVKIAPVRDISRRHPDGPSAPCRVTQPFATRREPASRRPSTFRGSGSDFPILSQKIHGKPLVYLDNAATTQKPQAVIDAMVRSYAEDNANIHRGVHLLSERATRAYEEARVKVQKFLNAPDPREDHLRARHDRGHQPGRPDVRPRQHRQGRRSARHRDGAPLEHRPVADASARRRARSSR